MVIREWRARASNESKSLYPNHFREFVLPKLRNLEGFVAASLLTRELDGEIEFVVITRWQSMQSVMKFAGPEFDKAVVEPEAAKGLLSYDRTVQHYDVVEEWLS